jgi:hypothetical protein
MGLLIAILCDECARMAPRGTCISDAASRALKVGFERARVVSSTGKREKGWLCPACFQRMHPASEGSAR